MEYGQILHSLRESGEYSDLTVVCSPATLKVHKCIVCLRSKWFAAACQQGRWKEGEEGVIELKAVDSHGEDEDFSCDDPDAVAFMIDFIYLGDYNLGPTAAVAASSSTVLAHEVLSVHLDEILATQDDNYPFTPIEPAPTPQHVLFNPWPPRSPRSPRSPRRNKKTKRVVEHGFERVMDAEAGSGSSTGIAQRKGSLTMHCRIYALAVKYDLSDLKKVAVDKMRLAVRGTWDREDFAKAIAVAFGATPDHDKAMRDIIVQTILSCSANLVTDPVVEKAINAVEGLPFELFKQQSTSAKRKGY